MSVVSDFLTTPDIWIAAPIGVVLGGVGGAFINSWTSKASDERKAAQEDKTNEEKRKFAAAQAEAKRQHDEKIEREKAVFESASEFASVCNSILVSAIDVKGVFNVMRDAFHNSTGTPDPKAFEKILFAETQIDEVKNLAGPYQRLQLVASPALLAAGTKLNASIGALSRTVAQPLARPVAMKAAADALNGFISVFREETGREAYTESDAQTAAMSFMTTLQQQVDAFVEEAKSDMRAAGFTTTPWDM
ncbi:hypothetical protein [Rhodococcus ruber]|uniref:hypothetical protein n=1 Tax=Rhodococcus ruber TaxID=1830 RepID=UPI00265EF0DD|nr:hypothetical protein [Rhodococcus ruber]MDO1482246.1 hypothetical protein [Rhodococcus ruber]